MPPPLLQVCCYMSEAGRFSEHLMCGTGAKQVVLMERWASRDRRLLKTRLSTRKACPKSKTSAAGR
eukprot:12182895-Alexandrium_andersonii.AAC.1